MKTLNLISCNPEAMFYFLIGKPIDFADIYMITCTYIFIHLLLIIQIMGIISSMKL